ncbi:MAG: hypothetical protein HYX32_09150 [Actinobacteria bacterium]|nr:hypothetical protein [Actinomycetota bacterium]
MSDSPQGPGWWQASDGKWYPPEQAPGAQQPGVPVGGGGTDLGSVFQFAWNKFIQNIGEWIVLWLILIGVVVAFAIVASVVVVGTGLGGFGGFRFNFLGIIIGLIGGAIQGILLVAIAKGAVQTANGQSIDLGSCFKFTGNNITAGIVFGLIIGLLGYFCFIFGIVGWLFFGFIPVLSALDDKGAESLSESMNLSTSHSNEALVWQLISWFIAGVVCSIGAPIAMLGGVYLVKRYRGEAVAA